ncbi:MAG: glycoside hydrolase, partial [Nocardiopsaceae bacterium]|nr:glycoside hydrolase [Nocardiopsaceae bacterium]
MTALGLTFTATETAVAATPGWAGESILSLAGTGNGWEPAIAADPSAPYVYAAWMQYSGTRVKIYYRVSADGGTTWNAGAPICSSCSTQQGQYDITLATSSSGVVYATWMQGNNISFAKSTDHGSTWSLPLTVSAGVWADKPWLTVSPSGNDIYVAWSTHGNVVVTSSHDGGATFTPPQEITNESSIYYYPNGGTVLPNGTVLFAASEYPEKGNNT